MPQKKSKEEEVSSGTRTLNPIFYSFPLRNLGNNRSSRHLSIDLSKFPSPHRDDIVGYRNYNVKAIDTSSCHNPDVEELSSRDADENGIIRYTCDFGHHSERNRQTCKVCEEAGEGMSYSIHGASSTILRLRPGDNIEALEITLQPSTNPPKHVRKDGKGRFLDDLIKGVDERQKGSFAPIPSKLQKSEDVEDINAFLQPVWRPQPKKAGPSTQLRDGFGALMEGLIKTRGFQTLEEIPQPNGIVTKNLKEKKPLQEQDLKEKTETRAQQWKKYGKMADDKKEEKNEHKAEIIPISKPSFGLTDNPSDRIQPATPLEEYKNLLTLNFTEPFVSQDPASTKDQTVWQILPPSEPVKKAIEPLRMPEPDPEIKNGNSEQKETVKLQIEPFYLYPRDIEPPIEAPKASSETSKGKKKKSKKSSKKQLPKPQPPRKPRQVFIDHREPKSPAPSSSGSSSPGNKSIETMSSTTISTRTVSPVISAVPSSPNPISDSALVPIASPPLLLLKEPPMPASEVELPAAPILSAIAPTSTLITPLSPPRQNESRSKETPDKVIELEPTTKPSRTIHEDNVSKMQIESDDREKQVPEITIPAEDKVSQAVPFLETEIAEEIVHTGQETIEGVTVSESKLIEHTDEALVEKDSSAPIDEPIFNLDSYIDQQSEKSNTLAAELHPPSPEPVNNASSVETPSTHQSEEAAAEPTEAELRAKWRENMIRYVEERARRPRPNRFSAIRSVLKISSNLNQEVNMDNIRINLYGNYSQQLRDAWLNFDVKMNPPIVHKPKVYLPDDTVPIKGYLRRDHNFFKVPDEELVHNPGPLADEDSDETTKPNTYHSRNENKFPKATDINQGIVDDVRTGEASTVGKVASLDEALVDNAASQKVEEKTARNRVERKQIVLEDSRKESHCTLADVSVSSKDSFTGASPNTDASFSDALGLSEDIGQTSSMMVDTPDASVELDIINSYSGAESNPSDPSSDETFTLNNSTTISDRDVDQMETNQSHGEVSHLTIDGDVGIVNGDFAISRTTDSSGASEQILKIMDSYVHSSPTSRESHEEISGALENVVPDSPGRVYTPMELDSPQPASPVNAKKLESALNIVTEDQAKTKEPGSKAQKAKKESDNSSIQKVVETSSSKTRRSKKKKSRKELEPAIPSLVAVYPGVPHITALPALTPPGMAPLELLPPNFPLDTAGPPKNKESHKGQSKETVSKEKKSKNNKKSGPLKANDLPKNGKLSSQTLDDSKPSKDSSSNDQKIDTTASKNTSKNKVQGKDVKKDGTVNDGPPKKENRQHKDVSKNALPKNAAKSKSDIENNNKSKIETSQKEMSDKKSSDHSAPKTDSKQQSLKTNTDASAMKATAVKPPSGQMQANGRSTILVISNSAKNNGTPSNDASKSNISNADTPDNSKSQNPTTKKDSPGSRDSQKANKKKKKKQKAQGQKSPPKKKNSPKQNKLNSLLSPLTCTDFADPSPTDIADCLAKLSAHAPLVLHALEGMYSDGEVFEESTVHQREKRIVWVIRRLEKKGVDVFEIDDDELFEELEEELGISIDLDVDEEDLEELMELEQKQAAQEKSKKKKKQKSRKD